MREMARDSCDGAAVHLFAWLYARDACGVLDAPFSISLHAMDFSVHGKVCSLSPLSLGALDLSIERPPFQARVAYGLTLAATPWVWPLARHLI